MAATEFAGTERFELRSRLGAGGMGVVYEALDRERDVRVALKTLRAPSAEALLRLKREFRALQGLEHPNLVNLGELIEAAGQWFFTMELIDGIDLLTWVRPGSEIPSLAQTADSPFGEVAQGAARSPNAVGGTLDLSRLRQAIAQLASGLFALHRAHKVHRDIKPSNVLVTPAGRVVLLDFGLIAEGFGDRDEGRVTGTPAYMAPEQSASDRVGPEADWYAMGVVLFEALTGRLPFDGAPLELLLDKQARP
ncbi:MAG: serine/threonine-protein kinase, partial [Polyangia bacterium]